MSRVARFSQLPGMSHRERLERLLLALEQVKGTLLEEVVAGTALCEYVQWGLEEAETHANQEGEMK